MMNLSHDEQIDDNRLPMIPSLAKATIIDMNSDNNNIATSTKMLDDDHTSNNDGSPRKKRRIALMPRKKGYGESSQDMSNSPSSSSSSSSPTSPDEFITGGIELQLMFPHVHLKDDSEDEEEDDIQIIYSTPRQGSLRRYSHNASSSCTEFLPIPTLNLQRVAATGINNNDDDAPTISLGPRIRPMFRRVAQDVKRTPSFEPSSRLSSPHDEECIISDSVTLSFETPRAPTN